MAGGLHARPGGRWTWTEVSQRAPSPGLGSRLVLRPPGPKGSGGLEGGHPMGGDPGAPLTHWLSPVRQHVLSSLPGLARDGPGTSANTQPCTPCEDGGGVEDIRACLQ